MKNSSHSYCSLFPAPSFSFSFSIAIHKQSPNGKAIIAHGQ
jgi:hypothetical protein